MTWSMVIEAQQPGGPEFTKKSSREPRLVLGRSLCVLGTSRQQFTRNEDTVFWKHPPYLPACVANSSSPKCDPGGLFPGAILVP